jgi:hypothetical protein
MTPEILIDRLRRAKKGNKDLALFLLKDEHDADVWVAMIGNTCPYVLIGETTPEFQAEGDTIEQALGNLLLLVE